MKKWNWKRKRKWKGQSHRSNWVMVWKKNGFRVVDWREKRLRHVKTKQMADTNYDMKMTEHTLSTIPIQMHAIREGVKETRFQLWNSTNYVIVPFKSTISIMTETTWSLWKLLIIGFKMLQPYHYSFKYIYFILYQSQSSMSIPREHNLFTLSVAKLILPPHIFPNKSKCQPHKLATFCVPHQFYAHSFRKFSIFKRKLCFNGCAKSLESVIYLWSRREWLCIFHLLSHHIFMEPINWNSFSINWIELNPLYYFIFFHSFAFASLNNFLL